MEQVIKATVVHNKHGWPANENAREYIMATFNSTITKKYDKSVVNVTFKHERSETFIVAELKENIKEGRFNVVHNNIKKQMRNFTKRYNNHCYVSNID